MVDRLTDHPILVLLVAWAVLWVSTAAGAMLRRARGAFDAQTREDFNIVQGATLTLLGLIIGFSFSMATSRYDQRKTLEEGEANAIGTAYARADLYGPGGSAIKAMLRDYTTLRVRYYSTPPEADLRDLEARTADLQDDLWAASVKLATAQPSPLSALAVASVNDVVNAQGYTQAAWWNRIPVGAWCLLFAISASACGMIGFGARAPGRERLLLSILPLIVAVSLFLIADIDSPRGGVIRVAPQNLVALARSLH